MPAENGVSTDSTGNSELIAIRQGTGGALEFGGLLGGLRFDRSFLLTAGFRPLNPSLMTWTLPTAGTYILFASLRSHRTSGVGTHYGPALIRLKDRAQRRWMPNSERMWSDFSQYSGDPQHLFGTMGYTHSFVWGVTVTSPSVIEIEAMSTLRNFYHTDDGNGFTTMNSMKVNPALSASRIVDYNGRYVDVGPASDRNIVALYEAARCTLLLKLPAFFIAR